MFKMTVCKTNSFIEEILLLEKAHRLHCKKNGNALE